MTLSPAAQAVLDVTRFEMNAECYAAWIAAAVIRSAVAVTQQYQGTDCLSDEVWTCDADALLAIADELDQSTSIKP